MEIASSISLASIDLDSCFASADLELFRVLMMMLSGSSGMAV